MFKIEGCDWEVDVVDERAELGACHWSCLYYIIVSMDDDDMEAPRHHSPVTKGSCHTSFTRRAVRIRMRKQRTPGCFKILKNGKTIRSCTMTTSGIAFGGEQSIP